MMFPVKAKNLQQVVTELADIWEKINDAIPDETSDDYDKYGDFLDDIANAIDSVQRAMTTIRRR